MIIGLIGEKLAGKDTAAQYLVTKYEARHIRTSQILDELLQVLGLPITRQNEIDAGRGMEMVFGPTIIGETVRKRVTASNAPITIINGLRLADQFEDAKALGAKIIYITAPPEVRFQRSLERTEESKDSAVTLEDFMAQDKTWTEKNIPEFGAKADYKIENIHGLDELHKNIDEIVTKIQTNGATQIRKTE